MEPISLNNPNIYKGPSSSTEFNRIRNEMHQDLMNLFQIANRHEQEIKDNMDILIRSNFFLQNKVVELETSLEKIAYDMMQKEWNQDNQRAIKTFYSLEGLSDGDAAKEAYVNTTYGYSTVYHSDTVSKISFKTSDNDVVIPESLQVSVLESNNVQPINSSTGMLDYYPIDDENVALAFDRDKNSFWVHTSSFPEDSGVSEVYGILHIKLPLDALNDIYSNVLTINPFPEYSMTIRDIQVKGYGEQWFRLPNFPTMKENNMDVPAPMTNTGKTSFVFPKTEITEIQILFAQPYWFSNEGQRDFVYGFQEIELEHRIYNSNEAEIVSEFSLEGTTKRFHIIETPTVVALPGSDPNINDLVEHKLYYNKDLTNEFNFGNEIMAPVQKVYVKTIIKGHGETIPFIRQINLDYEFKELAD